MKKFFYSHFAFVLISSQSIVAAGYLATYSIKVSDPEGYVKALDDLMGTNWGKVISSSSFTSSICVQWI